MVLPVIFAETILDLCDAASLRLHLFAPLSARVSSALGNVCFAVDDEY